MHGLWLPWPAVDQKTALAISRELVREAYDVDDALLALLAAVPASRAVPTDRPSVPLAAPQYP